MSTPVPHLSRSNSAIRASSSTPAPQLNGLGPAGPAGNVAGASAAEAPSSDRLLPQAYTTNYATRVKNGFQTMLIVPAVQASTSTLPPRSARRGQTTVNYAEDDDDDFGGDSRRGGGGAAAAAIIPEEVTEPVSVGGKYPHRGLPWRRTLEQAQGLADLPEILIPVNYERDIDATKKIRDRFTWNLFEGDITFERFARQFCQDLDLDPRVYVEDMVTTIRTACQEWAPIATLPLPDKFVDPISGTEGYYLIPVKLNVQCGIDTLTDQFMYNLFEEEITPEDFADQICNDIGYHGEYRNAVTTAIREEILKAKKEIFFPSGAGTHYNWKADAHIKFQGIRYDPENQGRDWSPNVEKLTREEVERKEIDRERETRRLRRETTKLNPANAAPIWFYGNNGVPTPGLPVPGVPGGGLDLFSRRKRQPTMRDREDSPMRKDSTGGQGGASTPTPLASTPVPLGDNLIHQWKCTHCNLNGPNTWGIRDGPTGKYTLCAICGWLFYENRVLPGWREGMFENDLWDQEIGRGEGYEIGGA